MLEGIKIIEMATYVAAPGAGGIMADWGAEVIKIEPLTGCPMRHFLSNLGASLSGNPVFAVDNRGKKGVALNTGTPEGIAAVKKLVETADVFLTNVRPGGLERAGLDYESLKAINPRLIYASVTGYGLQGPDRDRPGFDAAAFYGRSGFGQLSTPKGAEPAPLRTAVGDHITAMATAAGVLAALVERGRTGQGRLVEASLLRAGTYALGADLSIQLMYGKLASSKSRHEAISPIFNFFQTREGRWITIVPRQGGVDWPAICRAIGQPGLIEDPRFSTPKLRRTNAAALVDILDRAFAAYDLDEWQRRLDAEDMIWAPLMHPSDVVRDPQAIAAGAFADMPARNGQPGYRTPASPVRFPGADDGPKGPVPELGEHTQEVLLAAGYTKDELEILRRAGAIA